MLKIDIYSFTRDWIPKELTGDHDHTPCYKEGHTPLVEQLECEVVHRDLEQASQNLSFCVLIVVTHLSYSQDGLCRPLDKPHCGGHG